MRAGHRSRSPPRIDPQRDVAVGHQLAVLFDKIRRERRGGRNWRRRYRSVCLRLLEHLQYLYQVLIQSTYPGTSRQILQRAGQIDTAINQCRADQLPKRSEPLLPRLPAESEADSEAVESIALTSESETEPVETTERSSSGVWGGRYSGVQITANNPLLRGSASSSNRVSSLPASSSARVSLPSAPSTVATSSQPLVLPLGVEVEPLPNSKVTARLVLSLDWHQVLDTLRLRDQVQRPRGYYILPQIANQLQRLKQVVPGIVIVVNSFCHCPEFRISVLSIPDTVIDYRIVTDQKCGAQGKLQALLSIFDAERFVHCDDNSDVCDEFLQRIVNSRATDRPQFNIVGIRVPRRWRQQRCLPVEWKGNVIEAISSCFNLN